MQVPKLDLDPNSRSSNPNDYFGYPLNPLIHFLISSLRIRAAWLQSFSQIFHKWKQIYIDYFPLWFTHFALVLKNSSCFQNNNDNKTNRLQNSRVAFELRHQGAWFWFPTQLLTAKGPWLSYFPSLCLSFLLKMGRIIVPTSGLFWGLKQHCIREQWCRKHYNTC